MWFFLAPNSVLSRNSREEIVKMAEGGCLDIDDMHHKSMKTVLHLQITVRNWMKFCCRHHKSMKGSVHARFAKPITDEDIMKKAQNSTPVNTQKQTQWAIHVWGS